MKQLKDMGFGKSSMEDMILDEVEDLSQLLLKVKITNVYKFHRVFSIPFHLHKKKRYGLSHGTTFEKNGVAQILIYSKN